MNKKLIILILAGIVLIGLGFFGFYLKTSGANFESSRWVLPLVIIAALMDSINPCAFSVLLLTIAFLFSIGRLRKAILLIGTAYILGVFLVYMAIGLGIIQTLYFFGLPHFMARLGASILILFGSINLLNQFFPQFPIKLKIPSFAHRRIALFMQKASVPTAFILGSFVGLTEFPCTGGPYLMILGLLHDKTTYLTGLGYLVLYNFIFVLPLIIILLIASNKNLFNKVQEWRKAKTGAIRLLGGIAMLILGLIIFLL